MVELFVKDIREGIAGTGVRASFLKCAIEEPGLTPGVERVMRAVGQSQVETGVPITVHTNPHTESGLVAQKVLAEEGADLTKVVIGHSGDTTDLDYLCALADAGSLLGMDRFGLEPFLSFEGSCQHRGGDGPSRLRGGRWFWHMTRRVSSTTSPVLQEKWHFRTGTTPTSVMMSFRRCSNVVSPKTRSRRCWWTTHVGISRAEI